MAMSEDRDEERRYYEPLIGAVVANVEVDDTGIWIHFMDGNLLEIHAESEGFSTEIHPHEEVFDINAGWSH
jgi:hypothetical protein